MTSTPTTESQRPVSSPSAWRWRASLKVVLGLAALGALVLLGRRLGSYIPEFSGWLESIGFWGPILFIAGYVVAAVALIPGSLLTLAAGAVFGLFEGTLYVFVGASAGATAAFLVARYVARQAVERRIEQRPRFRAIDKAVAREGLKIVFLLRLSPIFPFNLLNYALGLTRVRFRDYLAGCFGMLPATFLYVYYGKALGTVAAVASGAPVERGAGYWVVLGLGLVATIAVTAVVTRLARRALGQEIADA
ncbi:MAG: TVP38/TMEM64 family protein [Acidobacteriota bacterium]|nr:TVP38/TMEM64 family protein [Acidobacteriota bacterium]